MAVRTILCFPDPALRTKAKSVEHFGDETQQLIDDLLETMYERNGVGLAATQIDEHWRVVVMDVSEDRDQPLVLVNPEITDKQGQAEETEGCISFPGIFHSITRAKHITFNALDRTGQRYEMEAEGLLAVCVQHEVDHLIGRLFIDYLSPLKRDRILKKMRKLNKLNL